MTMQDADLQLDLSVLKTEPADEYHGRASAYLSSHQLIDFMDCPRLYQKKRLGLVELSDTPAMFMGRAAHCRILEGRDAFEQQFAIGGPVNKQTGRPFGKNTKAFTDWCNKLGKPGVHHDDLSVIEQMATGVAMNEEAVDLLVYGQAEGVVRTTYCDTPCQIRIDWLNPYRGLVDLKTTEDLTWFENQVKRRRYQNQVAFYRSVLATALGVAPDTIPAYIVAVEKVEPFRCGVWRVSDNTLAIATQENEAAIERLKRAWQTEDFPTGYEQVRLLDVA